MARPTALPPPRRPRAAGRAALAGFTAPAVAWAVYDFANTIFSYAVVTRYFNEWIIDERGQPDWVVGAMGFTVSVLLVATLPVLGALADRRRIRKRLVVGFTVLCAAATAGLGLVTTTVAALVIGGVAIFAFSSALAHYDPLLASVAAPEHHGRVSGLGVGLGYVGVLVALAVLGAVVGDGSDQRAFLPTALLLLLFSLPLFLLVHEQRDARAPERETARAATRRAFGEVRDTLRAIRSRPVGRLLLARFLYVDAIATVIAYMTIYAQRVADFDDGRVTVLLALSVVFAALGAFAAGALVERVGPRRVLIVVLSGFVAALLAEAATGAVALLWLVGPVVGVTLGAVWTSDRVLVLRLTGEHERGRVFALYALVGKLSSGVGPLLLWGGVIWVLHDRGGLLGDADASRVALAALAVAALAGTLLLRPLDDDPAGRPVPAARDVPCRG